MDFLNKGFAQLAELFRSMTPGARLTAALLLIVTVVSLAYLFNHQVAGPDAYLLGGQVFSSSQLGEMQAALGKAGLECTIEGQHIKVPRGQEAKCMAALAEANALPIEFGQRLQKALGVNSFWSNRGQQEALVKNALQQSLQDTINEISTVEKSAVQIAEDAKRETFGKKVVTASVSIWTKGSQRVDRKLVETVRELVAFSVAGLKPEAITVVDARAGQSFAGVLSDNRAGGMSGDYVDRKKDLEQYYQGKIIDSLSYISGVIVAVNVELNSEITDESTSTEYDPKSVVFEVRETTGNKTVEGGSPGGRPGLSAQGGVANQAAVLATSAGMRNNEESAQKEKRSAVPTTHQHIVRAGLTPKLVTAAIKVPHTYYEEVWRKMNPTEEGQPEKKPEATALADLRAKEEDMIEETILRIIPVKDKTADAYPQVTVATFHPISSPPLPEVTMQATTIAWLGEYWSTLGMAGLALVSLVMLRSMVKAVPSAPPVPAIAETPLDMPQSYAPAVEHTAYEEPVESTSRGRLKRRSAGGPSLQDELAGIVQEDPEAAVNILRAWIGNAS